MVKEIALKNVIKSGKISFSSEISSQIQDLAFDYLDAPVLKIGAPNSIPPTSQVLEKIFLPNAEKITKIVKTIF